MLCTIKKIFEFEDEFDVDKLSSYMASMIKEREFYEVRGKDWYIYSQASNIIDTSAEDLVYESAGNYMTLMDYIDEHPLPVWKWDKDMIEHWIQYLYDNDFLF